MYFVLFDLNVMMSWIVMFLLYSLIEIYQYCVVFYPIPMSSFNIFAPRPAHVKSAVSMDFASTDPLMGLWCCYLGSSSRAISIFDSVAFSPMSINLRRPRYA